MIIKPELVKRIKEYFGLNIYETKVWLALLTKGIASAGEVAELSGVPRSRTYDVLESLEKQGFAITKIGKPVKYIAVKPTEVVEKIKSKTMLEANERVVSLSNLKETPEYTELEQLHTVGIAPIKSHEITGSIKGRSNILSKIREMIENSKKEVLIVTSVSDFEDKSRVLIPTLDRLSKSNVKVRVALSGEEDKIKKISSRFDVKPKMTDSKAKLFISDKSEALFIISPENSEEEMALWLQSPFFTQSITNILEDNFKKA